MCYIKAEDIKDGFIESECFAYFKSAKGSLMEVILPRSQVKEEENLFQAWTIAEKGDTKLVELPRETTGGYWRAWVNTDLIVEDA